MSKNNKSTTIQKQITHLHDTARDTLADKHQKAWKKLKDTKPPIEHFVSQSKHLATSAAIAGSLLLPKGAVDVGANAAPQATQSKEISVSPISAPEHPGLLSQKVLTRLLNDALPQYPQKLPEETSTDISTHVESALGIKAVSELDGYQLNTDFGYMGAEQHLPRFPGDTIDQHDEIQQSGITKGRGAFGYFADSKAALGEKEIQQEKYYMVVQSWLSPSWNQNSRAFKDWLKFRKVVAINPDTGKAVVGVIGDAGPAKWTGKQFGGSPEVIRELNNGKHSAKTTVVLLFVDDPEDTIPLGPVN